MDTNIYYDDYNMRSSPSRATTAGIYVNASLGRSSKSRRGDLYSTEYYGRAGDRPSRHSSSSPKTYILSRSPKRRGAVQVIQDSDSIPLGPFALANSLGMVNERRRSRDHSTSGPSPKSPKRRASADEGLYIYDDSREYRRARRGSTPRLEQSIGTSAGRDTENWSTKAEPPYSRLWRSATFSGDIPPAVKQLRFEERDSRRARIDRQNEEINQRRPVARPVSSADRSAPGRGILKRESFGGALAAQDDETLRRAVEGMNLQQFQMPEQRLWSNELAASRSRNRSEPYAYRPRDEQGEGYYYVERQRGRDRRSRRASMPGPLGPVYYEYGGAHKYREGGDGGSRPRKARWVMFR